MIKKVLASIIILSLLFTFACDIGSTPTPTPTTASEIVNTVQLASEWEMNQMRIVVNEEDEMSLLLKLDSGDDVDGYFYLEDGEHVNFEITGNSRIYVSKSEDKYGQITSDRFNFTASQAQGTTYSLTFENNTDSPVTVFLEIIYPDTASMYVPVTSE
jgi:hypothetical protein